METGIRSTKRISMSCGRLVSLLILLAVPTVVSGVQSEDGREKIRRNKIKSVTAWEHKVETGVTQEPGAKFYYQEFDKQGNQVEAIGYDRGDGTVLSRENTTYDSQGRAVETKSQDILKAGEQKTSYHFDAKRKLTKSITRGPGGSPLSKTTYQYDAKGNLLERVWYQPPDKVRIRYAFRRDAEGNIVEQSESESDGTVAFRTTQEFNPQRNVIGTTSYDAKGDVTAKVKYEYDEKQYLTEKKQYRPDGSLWVAYSYKYDAGGVMTEEIESDAKGAPVRVTRYEYEFYP